MSYRQHVLACAFFAISVGATWPLGRSLQDMIPKGVESSPTVPVLNLWTVGFNADRVRHGCSAYWEAPHFFPASQTFALSEPIVTSQLVAPLVWLTGSPVVAYNLLMLGAISLNGWTTWGVLVARGCHWPIAVLGGWMMLRLPFVFWQLGVIQSVPIAGIIATLHFTADAFETGRRRSFLGAGASLGLTYLTCGYHGLFTVMLLSVSVFVGWALLPVGRGGRAKVPILRLLGGVAVAAVLIGPVAMAQKRVLSNPVYERPLELVRDLSAQPSDYLATPFPELLRFVGLTRAHDPSRWALSPGLWKCVLSMAGIWLGLRSIRRRAWVLFLTIISAGALVGSLGLNLDFAGWCPYRTLLDWVPGLAKVRAPGRFAVFVQIGVVLLSMETLQYLQRWGTIRWRRSNHEPQMFKSSIPMTKEISNSRFQAVFRSLRFGHWGFQSVVWMAGLFACWEVPLPPIRLVKIPRVETQQGWIGWLTQNTRRETIVAHLPFPAGKSVKDYESEAWAMYWGLFHERRMVNGYSGFFPPGYLKLKEQVQRFPDPESLATLRASGVSYCVISLAFAESRDLENNEMAQQKLERVFRDDLAGVLIFRLRK